MVDAPVQVWPPATNQGPRHARYRCLCAPWTTTCWSAQRDVMDAPMVDEPAKLWPPAPHPGPPPMATHTWPLHSCCLPKPPAESNNLALRHMQRYIRKPNISPQAAFLNPTLEWPPKDMRTSGQPDQHRHHHGDFNRPPSPALLPSISPTLCQTPTWAIKSSTRGMASSQAQCQ